MDENIDKWAKKVDQYSVNHHSHMQTKDIKAQEEEEEEKVQKPKISETSILQVESSPRFNYKISSARMSQIHHKPGLLAQIQDVQ